MALIAKVFPSASLQLPCPGAILHVTALQSHPSVLCRPTVGPRALKAVGSHHPSCHWGLWAANEFKNIPRNRKAFELTKIKHTICCCVSISDYDCTGGFTKISVPFVTIVCLHLGWQRGFINFSQPCRTWLLWHPPPDSWVFLMQSHSNGILPLLEKNSVAWYCLLTFAGLTGLGGNGVTLPLTVRNWEHNF